MILIGCNLSASEMLIMNGILECTDESIYILDPKLRSSLESVILTNPVEQIYLINNTLCDWSGEDIIQEDSIIYCTSDYNLALKFHTSSPIEFLEGLQSKTEVKFLNEL